MKDENPQAGTVPERSARGEAADPLGRYLDRRLHAALATLAQPDAGRAARNGARAVIEELHALADVLDRQARAEQTTTAMHRAFANDPEGVPQAAYARGWYRRHADYLIAEGQRAANPRTQLMLDVTAAEMDTLAELLAESTSATAEGGQ
jgi:hypothetical protein